MSYTSYVKNVYEAQSSFILVRVYLISNTDYTGNNS